jgi:hypothetical protein
MKCKKKVMPVITGVTGIISKSPRQYQCNVPGKHEIKKLQKTNHIGHCTPTLKSANVKVQNIFHGRNNIMCSINCKYRTAATNTIYPRNVVCFRYIIVNTLHEGDNRHENNYDDDDDNNNNITEIRKILLSSQPSLSPLCRVSTHIFPRQTMSLRSTLLQPFYCCCLWCLYL